MISKIIFVHAYAYDTLNVYAVNTKLYIYPNELNELLINKVTIPIVNGDHNTKFANRESRIKNRDNEEA